MRVSRAQAEENRRNVIDVASRLFREHGFDGIGVKDVMEAAGLTHGGFYKQFASKEDLVAQASGRALETAFERWAAAVESDPRKPLDAIIRFYLSMEHRAETQAGCPIVSLAPDAARQGADVKAAFEEGIRDYLAFVEPLTGAGGTRTPRQTAMAFLATLVGAQILARAVNDDALSRELLDAAASSLRAQLGDDTTKAGR